MATAFGELSLLLEAPRRRRRPPPETKSGWPNTTVALAPVVLPAGNLTTRLLSYSATQMLQELSRSIPEGPLKTLLEVTYPEETKSGWPNTTVALAPVVLPAVNLTTRLLSYSATQSSPEQPTAAPHGPLMRLLEVPDPEETKSGWPKTTEAFSDCPEAVVRMPKAITHMHTHTPEEPHGDEAMLAFKACELLPGS